MTVRAYSQHAIVNAFPKWSKEHNISEISEKVSASYERMSEYTVYRTLLHIGLHSRLVKVPMPTLSTAENAFNGYVSIRTGQWKKVALSVFSFIM